MTESFVIGSPIGFIKVRLDNDQLSSIEFVDSPKLLAPSSAYGKKTEFQLKSYFNNPDFTFDISIKKQGTEFQQKVWAALQEIPKGSVMTYGELAKKLHSSARAIGNACRRNPTPVVVPCHRIVAASGLGGFAGATSGQLTDIKQHLLKLEGVQFSTQLELNQV